MVANDLITTGVDELIAFLEGKDRVSLLDTAKELNVQVDILQSWVDFLVEEGLVGIEYKFTKPYIYLNKRSTEKTKVVKEEHASWEAFKQAFLQKAAEKKIPEVKAASLWENHVLTALEKQKRFFYDEARKREVSTIDALWEQYKQSVLAQT